ncbi:MAG TPA: hypothetical protein VGI84_09180 [Pseudonocardiaceae bacterium]
MKLYAERPGRRLGQLTADLLAIGWLAAGARLAWWVFDQLTRLQAPGTALEQAGHRISGTFTSGAAAAGRVPLVGDELAGALGTGNDAGASLAAAGRSQVEAVSALATGAAGVVLLAVLLPLLLWWLPARWRYARAAGAAAAVRAGDTDLLALRALVELPARRLLAASPDPAAAWRSGDPEACRRLANLQLAKLGLRPVGG